MKTTLAVLAMALLAGHAAASSRDLQRQLQKKGIAATCTITSANPSSACATQYNNYASGIGSVANSASVTILSNKLATNNGGIKTGLTAVDTRVTDLNTTVADNKATAAAATAAVDGRVDALTTTVTTNANTAAAATAAVGTRVTDLNITVADNKAAAAAATAAVDGRVDSLTTTVTTNANTAAAATSAVDTRVTSLNTTVADNKAAAAAATAAVDGRVDSLTTTVTNNAATAAAATAAVDTKFSNVSTLSGILSAATSVETGVSTAKITQTFDADNSTYVGSKGPFVATASCSSGKLALGYGCKVTCTGITDVTQKALAEQSVVAFTRQAITGGANGGVTCVAQPVAMNGGSGTNALEYFVSIDGSEDPYGCKSGTTIGCECEVVAQVACV